MEGLIPLLYKAIVQYRNGGQGPNMQGSSWLISDSPSASYMRLPGDSGRFQSSEIQLFQSDHHRVAAAASSTSQLIVSAAGQSPLFRSNSRRLIS